jgi:hypothetical protein
VAAVVIMPWSLCLGSPAASTATAQRRRLQGLLETVKQEKARMEEEWQRKHEVRSPAYSTLSSLIAWRFLREAEAGVLPSPPAGQRARPHAARARRGGGRGREGALTFGQPFVISTAEVVVDY